MVFETSAQIRFAHVDFAGITFYPRYFEMLNGAVEDWFARAIGADFRSMHSERGIGVPTVQLSANFLSPSTLGDELTIRIIPTRIGRSSCQYDALFTADSRDRLKVSATLVCMHLETQKSVPWPDDIRMRMMEDLALVS
ncbi:MAG: thioesterase family protein [Sphingorhabdus sp.]